MNTKTYFDNKVVWITGASSGIGKEFCIQLDQMGAILILSSRNKNALVELKESLSHSEKHQIQVLEQDCMNTLVNAMHTRKQILICLNQLMERVAAHGDLEQRINLYQGHQLG